MCVKQVRGYALSETFHRVFHWLRCNSNSEKSIHPRLGAPGSPGREHEFALSSDQPSLLLHLLVYNRSTKDSLFAVTEGSARLGTRNVHPRGTCWCLQMPCNAVIRTWTVRNATPFSNSLDTSPRLVPLSAESSYFAFATAHALPILLGLLFERLNPSPSARFHKRAPRLTLQLLG